MLQSPDRVLFQTSRILNAQTGDMICEDVCCINRVNAVTLSHTHTQTQMKPQIPRGLPSALHTRRILISGCWLTPFNRILLVLGFLCSVEDTHGMSLERCVCEREVGVGERGRHRLKSEALAGMAMVHELRVALMTLPVRQALSSQAIFSPGER